MAIAPQAYNGEMNQSHLQFLASPEWKEMLETDLLPWLAAAGDLGDDVLEIGPGPGLTTDLLRARVSQLTALEVDPTLAEPLRERLVATNVDVICGDATSSRLEPDRFSAATCFSMLHHLPTPAKQDQLFAEVFRVLRDGGLFVGTDSRDLELIRAGHVDDIFVPIDPETLADRLEVAGLVVTQLDVDDYQFRFTARKAL
jgi:SAM-dependent methyltransferase